MASVSTAAAAAAAAAGSSAVSAALISSSTTGPPMGQLNWYLHVQGKAALPKVLDAVKRV
jgi:Spy/CpxP family protein refolding chaperone